MHNVEQFNNSERRFIKCFMDILGCMENNDSMVMKIHPKVKSGNGHVLHVSAVFKDVNIFISATTNTQNMNEYTFIVSDAMLNSNNIAVTVESQEADRYSFMVSDGVSIGEGIKTSADVDIKAVATWLDNCIREKVDTSNMIHAVIADFEVLGLEPVLNSAVRVCEALRHIANQQCYPISDAPLYKMLKNLQDALSTMPAVRTEIRKLHNQAKSRLM